MIGRTRAVVLAAGLGSRLGPATLRRPKCLMRVGGHTLLDRAMGAMAATGVAACTVVVGHLAASVRHCADAWAPQLDVRCVENPEFATTGTARSLALGIGDVAPNEDLLVVEADVVFERATLQRLLSMPGPVTTVVAPFTPPVSGSAVLCAPDGRVLDWLHAEHQGPEFRREDARKTVNLTRLDPPSAVVLRDRCAAARPDAALERVLRYVVQRRELAVRAMDVEDARWWEIDTPDDLRIAEELFREEPAG